MNKSLSVKNYTHYQGGHCESGSVYSLLRNYGFDISEPMALGISSNIGFAFLPFIRVWGHPLIAFRLVPRTIIKGVQKRLGVRFFTRTYDDQKEAMDELDRLLIEGKPVGLQATIAYLPYFLGEWMIPFNGHMMIVYGRDGDEYLVSDPLYDHVTRVTYDNLRKARFATGPNAPKGFIFYPIEMPETVNYKKTIIKSVKKVAFMMLQPMFPYYGILGIKSYARSVRKLQKNTDVKYKRSFLNNIFMFQELVGTGGGGFRYMYAAFLKEAYDMLKMPALLETSKKMVEAGNKWREAAASCAKFIQGKTDKVDLNKTADLYLECARMEKEIYLLLRKIKRK
jgi:hypothetical protein